MVAEKWKTKQQIQNQHNKLENKTICPKIIHKQTKQQNKKKTDKIEKKNKLEN